MRKYFKIMLAVSILIALLISGPAAAADSIFSKFMTGTTTAGVGTTYTYGAYVVIPGDSNGQVVVASVSGTSDGTAATNNIYVYDKENEATINSTSSAGATALGIASGGASFDANDLIVLQSPSGAVYLESVASSGAATIAINGALDVEVSSGWKVYEMSQIGKIPVGNATASYQSDVAVVAGTKDSPVLMVLGGTAACSINFASGHYR